MHTVCRLLSAFLLSQLDESNWPSGASLLASVHRNRTASAPLRPQCLELREGRPNHQAALWRGLERRSGSLALLRQTIHKSHGALRRCMHSIPLHRQLCSLLTPRVCLSFQQRSGFNSEIWGIPKPLHLKPEHLQMVFFSARRHLHGAFPV